MKPANHILTKAPRKRKTRNKMEDSQPRMKPPKRVNHEGNIKFPNPLHSREAYQIRKGERRHFSSSKQSILFM
jgi:hypothetical protein